MGKQTKLERTREMFNQYRIALKGVNMVKEILDAMVSGLNEEEKKEWDKFLGNCEPTARELTIRLRDRIKANMSYSVKELIEELDRILGKGI